MLRQIVAEKQVRVAERKKALPEEEVKALLADSKPVRPFRSSLQQQGMSVIAEIKKASPSRGNFGLTRDVESLAHLYEKGGAAAVSVLTEESCFGGKANDLVSVRDTLLLPVLRKDFIVDRYQLFESRMLGADAVLLIAGLLSARVLADFLEICASLRLEALVETHTREDIFTALSAGATVIGINNRDLKTFSTDISCTRKLAHLVPPHILLVSESGIQSRDEVKLLSEAGVDAVLVGEALVRAADPVLKIRELRGVFVN
jgi:indole-3-glycerol phosphate synthase